MSIGRMFLTHWLDCDVDGHPIKEWCQCIKHETTKVHCTYCNRFIKFGTNGLANLKRHALSNKHKKNRKAAHLGRKEDADFSGEYFEPQETIDALALLYPGMNFNCSVDLLPLSVLYKASRQARNSDLVSLLQSLIKPETNSFIDVYICFSCGQEFVSRPTLHGHQKECGMKPLDFQALRHHESSVHQHESLSLPLSIMYQSSGEKMFSTLSTTKRQTTTSPYVLPSKDIFISALDLLPKKNALNVCNRRRNTECEIIDLDEDISISPTLPRTPKLLLSHLSRDGNENNGDNSSLCRVRRSLFCAQNSQIEKESIMRSESHDESGKEDNASKEKTRISMGKSLYSLDITSPLGQLVIKHFKGDPNLHVLSDVESHCLTSTPKKIVPAIQLRERHNTYPVTFNGLSGKFRYSHTHQYKFTRQQKVEFLRTVNTGLDKKSRVLQRKMKRCTVRLTHITKTDLKRWMLSTDEVTVDLKPLSADEIMYWTSPKGFVDINSNNTVDFPSGLTFSSPNVNNILGLKTCHGTAFHKKYNLSVANYVSEETYAEVTANRRAVYKSLLSDLDGCESYLLETESSQASTPISKPMQSSHYLQMRLATPVQTSQESTNINVTPQNMSSSSPCHHYQIDDSRKEGNNICNFFSSVNRNVSHSKSKLIDSYTTVPSKLSNFSDLKIRIVSTERKMREFDVGSLKSGIYDVQIRTALEGEPIQISSRNLDPVSSNKDSGVSKAEISRTGKRKFRRRKSAIEKSFDTSNLLKASDILKKDCLKSCGIFESKRRKVDNVIEKSKSSIKSTSTKNGSAVSKPKFSESGKIFSAKVEITRDSKVVIDALQSLTEDSLCPDPEKKLNTSQVREVERTQQGSKTEDCNTFFEEHKRDVNSKPNGCYRTFATVSSFGDCSLLNDKSLTPQANTYSCNLFHASGQQGENITEHKKPVYSPKIDTFSNERTEESALNNNYSISKKINQISHLNNTAEVAETKNIENRSAILYTTDSRSKKFVQEVQNSFVPTNISSNPISVSLKDKLSDSKLISQKHIPSTSPKFVTYSSSFSPQLRQSSLINTMPIARKAEIRKSHLTSFLLKPNGKALSTLLIKNSLTKSAKTAEHTKARAQFRQTSGSRKRK